MRTLLLVCLVLACLLLPIEVDIIGLEAADPEIICRKEKMSQLLISGWEEAVQVAEEDDEAVQEAEQGREEVPEGRGHHDGGPGPGQYDGQVGMTLIVMVI